MYSCWANRSSSKSTAPLSSGVRITAPRGLLYLVHAGIAVGIIKSKAVLCVIITAQHFLLRIYLRQAHTHNGAPDQAAACKINSLTKDAAHHAKTQKCFGRVRHKLSQKFSPSGIIQTAFLHKGANARVTCCKIFVYLPQICVAWEKRQNSFPFWPAPAGPVHPKLPARWLRGRGSG